MPDVEIVVDSLNQPDVEIIVDSAIGTCATHIDEITAVVNNLTNINSVKDNATNINTVASNITKVNNVGNDIVKVNAVADDLTKIDGVYSIASDITTVATDIADVIAVGTNILNVNAVADNETNINAVNSNKTNIDTVAGISSNVTIVAGISGAVSTVSGIASAVSTVASNSTKINTVAGSISNVNSVADNISVITSVDSNETNINAVNSNKTNIDTVAGSISDINSVADNLTAISNVNSNESNINAVNSNATNINAVASNISNVNAVADNETNINAVATNETNIDTCATNISAITSAPTYATSASNSAGIATSQAQIATQQAALARQYAEETHGQSDVMVENVRAIPAYENYGYAQTESKGLEDLKKFNRSTFDLSKFSVIGTPTITDSGILSNASLSDFLNVSQNINGNKIVFHVGFKIVDDIPTGVGTMLYDTDGSHSTFYAQVLNVNGNYYLRVYASDKTAGHGGFVSPRDKSLQKNIDYIAVVELDLANNKETASVYTNAGLYQTASYTFPSSLSDWTELTNIKIGNGSYLDIDVKQFSITVDGVEVFNGNKTSIDVIKADDYTKVGSPTITTDGIASGFTGYTTYLDTEFNISSYTDWDIYYKLKTATMSPAVYQIFLCTKQQGLNIGFQNNRLFWAISTNGTSVATYKTSTVTFNTYTDYWLHFSYKNGVYTAKYSTDGVTYSDTGISITAGQSYSADIGLGSFIAGSVNQPFLGTIDLNEVKFYTNGNLSYQACLRIPYNQTKTGSKIVQYAYRDRVKDMYNQFGWANYYTLLEERKPHYNIVGSPTISSDYVASGFSASSYLATSSAIDLTSTNWEIQIAFTTGTISDQTILNLGGYAGLNIYLGDLAFTNGSSPQYSNVIYNAQANSLYQLKIGCNGTNYYIKYKLNGVEQTEISQQGSVSLNNAVATLGYHPLVQQTFLGSIDLKQFKIYVDNKLTYEAVEEPNFTVPYGENLDGHVTKVDWYKNGITTWEYDTNLDCIETGSCTSGTAVTLPKPMADDTYSLSVPYSAKSKTGFTPSASGDYIAKGKVVLG